MTTIINLNKLTMLDKDIDLISEQVEGKTTFQGMPIYKVESITGAIYFDKDEFIKLCLEGVKNAYNQLIFDVEILFNIRIKTTCNNGLEWIIDVVGEPKVCNEDEEVIYFDKFEII